MRDVCKRRGKHLADVCEVHAALLLAFAEFLDVPQAIGIARISQCRVNHRAKLPFGNSTEIGSSAEAVINDARAATLWWSNVSGKQIIGVQKSRHSLAVAPAMMDHKFRVLE